MNTLIDIALILKNAFLPLYSYFSWECNEIFAESQAETYTFKHTKSTEREVFGVFFYFYHPHAGI